MFVYTILFFTLITLSFTTPVIAETPISTSTNNNYRLEVKEARENQADIKNQNREETRTKFQTIKDDKKRQIIENISNLIASVNQKRTTIMANHLNRIEWVLEKLKIKTQTAKDDGKNVSSVETAIVSAETTIKSSRDKIAAQAVKQYNINISNEDALGTAVASTRQTFQADLKVVNDSVIAARKAVSTAIETLAKILGENITN